MFSFLTGTELRRFRRGLLPKLALVVMICIPLLYGALYLWAYWDPTGNLDKLPVALVNADTGATTDDGAQLTAGDDVVGELLDSDALNWKQTDADDAEAGVKDGTYYFAVTIPTDFSTDIASASGDNPVSAQLQVTYNDANSYLASTLGHSAMAQIRAAVSATIGEQAVDQVLVGLGSARDGFAQASDGALTLNAAAGQVSQAADELADGASSAADGAATLSTGASTLAEGTDQLADGTTELSDGAAQLSSGVGSAAAGASTLAEKSTELAAGASTAATSASTLASGAQQVSDGVDQLAQALTPVASALPQLSQGLTTLSTELLTMASTAEASGDTATAATLRSAASDLQTQTEPLTSLSLDSTALNSLVDGAHQVRDGSAQLSTGLGTLSSGASALSAGTQELSDGTGQAATAAATLASGASTLDTKVGDLDSGAQELADGAATLAEGTSTLADGTQQLADESPQMIDGTQQLADKLSDGAAQIPDDDDDARAQRSSAIASPVKTDDTDIASSATMGEGFAPFFIPLALFVGGLVTWLLLRALPSRALATPASGWRVALSGYLPALLIGVAQSIVLLAVVHLGLGLSWSTALGTVAFTVLIAAAFMAVQQMLLAVLGSAPGKVAIIALLMLQLTSASGTYPIETTPQFFQALHPYLPMTYAITGLRELLTGGTEGRLWISVVVLAAFTIGSLAITAWRAARMRTWTLSRLHPALEI